MSFFRPFALERFFAAHEFSARYLLCSSDCETITARELLGLEPGAEERLLNLRLGYTETRGAPSLREAISALYSGLAPDEVFVHAGAEEAILNLSLALVAKGDRVVVNFPCYQSLAEIPRSLGAEVLPWRFRESAGRWRLDLDELAGFLGQGSKLVILNLPHNPTGALLTREEFDAVVGLCREAGAVLFVDEVYRRLERDPRRRLPAACEAYENGVSLNVMSKSAGLAGLRIGWLATKRRDILDQVAVVKDYNSICSSGPSEVLAEVAARHFEELAERNSAICAANLSLLEDFFARRPGFVRWTPPEGGSIAFPRLAGEEAARWTGGKGSGDAELFALRLLEETGVLLLPGAYYGCDPAHFRLGFGRASMPEALTVLEGWLDGRK
jgi:aspartate/methionine/tyrosine aminotransferase